jgi:hypothetical protein
MYVIYGALACGTSAPQPSSWSELLQRVIANCLNASCHSASFIEDTVGQHDSILVESFLARHSDT